MKKKSYAALILVLGILLGGCGSGPAVSDTSVLNTDGAESRREGQDSEMQQDSETQQNPEMQPPETQGDSAGEGSSIISVDKVNSEILSSCEGMTVIQTIETPGGGIISVDAQIDVDGVSRVSRYRYIPQQFTEEKRKALFEKIFPAESWNVNEATVYNEKEDAWEIVTPRGESWVCQIRDSRISGEQIVNVERADIALGYMEESEVMPVQLSNAPVEDMLLFIELTNCTPSEIEQVGKLITASVTEEIIYSCNYIHILGKDGGHPYAKAVYKQTVDGMPVTTWHNIGTATSKERGFFPVKVWGSFCSVEEIGLDKPILTPAEAATAMQEQIGSIQMQEAEMCITKISLEYLSVISSEGTPEIVPIWRFWPGADETERCLRCESILAVNAISGELIQEERSAFEE